jgi:hypothetical protein
LASERLASVRMSVGSARPFVIATAACNTVGRGFNLGQPEQNWPVFARRDDAIEAKTESYRVTFEGFFDGLPRQSLILRWQANRFWRLMRDAKGVLRYSHDWGH